MIVLTDVQEKVAQRLMDITITTVGQYFDPLVLLTLDPLEERHQGCVDMLNRGDFQNFTAPVTKMLELLTDKPLSKYVTYAYDCDNEIPESKLLPGVVLVPIYNRASHDYPLDSPAMCPSVACNFNWITMDKSNDHNHIGLRIDDLRLPSIDEIRQLVAFQWNRISTSFIIL